MQLSEALILGECAVNPHFNNWYRFDQFGKVCGACAVGRLCLVAGYQPDPRFMNGVDEAVDIGRFMSKMWPWTTQFESRHLFSYANPILAEISYRYENERQTMKEIAAWIATIEPLSAPPAGVRVEEEVEA